MNREELLERVSSRRPVLDADARRIRESKDPAALRETLVSMGLRKGEIDALVGLAPPAKQATSLARRLGAATVAVGVVVVAFIVHSAQPATSPSPAPPKTTITIVPKTSPVPAGSGLVVPLRPPQSGPAIDHPAGTLIAGIARPAVQSGTGAARRVAPPDRLLADFETIAEGPIDLASKGSVDVLGLRVRAREASELLRAIDRWNGRGVPVTGPPGVVAGAEPCAPDLSVALGPETEGWPLVAAVRARVVVVVGNPGAIQAYDINTATHVGRPDEACGIATRQALKNAIRSLETLRPFRTSDSPR